MDYHYPSRTETKEEEEEGGFKTVIFFFASIIASLCYCYYLTSHVPKRIYRLISLLPIFYLFTILPLSLPYAFPTAVAALFITWLANFKLLLFAFDQGPLHPPESLTLFITVASLPVKIKSNSNPIRPTKTLPLNLWVEALAFAFFLNFLSNYKHTLHTDLVLIIYCCLVFLLIDILVAVSNAVIRPLVGVELESPSNEPYLSTSLQEFWGHRWNLMVTNILRLTVYKPVKSVFASSLGKDWAPVPAVLATFLVSGLMHEVLFYYVTRESPTWETTAFFVLHGVCVIVETGLKRVLAGKLEVPWYVSRPLTVGFVVGTSFWLFFPPLIKNGADVKALEEYNLLVEYIKMKLGIKV